MGYQPLGNNLRRIYKTKLMKKLLTALAFFCVLNASAQTAAQKDIAITDSTLIITIGDMKLLDEWMYKNLTAEQKDKIVPVINAIINEAVKRKKTKQK